ncbi:MAG: Re/Si-specific NAD(P)(+) transhydrogenase subunit alpha [Azospirillum brasilense]|nr:MAG: Re/Si-specific NAD(P)(+) transhydrogenase subunit alpha [Azospirillum brasilense]
MKIAIVKETAAGESRVATSPDAVKKFRALGMDVAIERGAGLGAAISDEAFAEAGAQMTDSAAAALTGADVTLTVEMPSDATIALIPEGSILVGMLDPLNKLTDFTPLNKRSIQAYAMELLPRISRAQSMDVLSSQSNLAGYRAVIEAVAATTKTIPMMMTAAGTIPPAKVLVLGAGVAGLQAIATAKRLGAVVSAFDVRAAVKEQVQSLGAKFVEVPAAAGTGETAGGYAQEMDEDYKKRQEQAIADSIKAQDIVISTALIPGKPAPRLISEAMVQSMKPGSVIVDLAAASGGNCALTKADAVTQAHGVTLIGYTNLPSRAASDAAPLYARNLLTFVTTLMLDKETKRLNVAWDDELVKGTLVTKGGQIIHPALQPQ